MCTPKSAALALLVACSLLFAACESPPPPTPRVVYPVTYDVPVGNTHVRADAGPQNLEVNAVQRVTAVPGQRLYYRVDSPVDVTLFVYEGTQSRRVLLGQMRGTSFTTSVVPTHASLEFVFSASDANSSGTVRFTLSDRPIAPAVSP